MKRLFTFLFILIALNKGYAQCQANFTYSLNAAGNVTFSNNSTFTSTNVIFTWNFGDYQSSNLVNPSHTYAGNGIYVVTLNLYDSISNNFPCYSSFSQTININSTVCLLTAFASTLQGSGGIVFFNDLSSGTIPLTSYTLDYGDNTTSSMVGGHTYSAAGLYTVILNEENSPSCTSTYSTVINVSVLNCSLNANFNFSINSGTVNFINTTSGASPSANYLWSFDNSNTSNAQNPPAQIYLYNGIYTVNLTVTDSTLFWCSSSISKTISITNASCYVNSSFTLVKDSTQMPAIVWNAYPNYPTNVVSTIWNWGDNTTSNIMYPTHTYSAAGVYNICLTLSVSCGSSTTTCINSNIFRNSGANSMAMVKVINTTAGIKYNTPFLNANWKIIPNPSNGLINISNLNDSYDNVIILNQLGEQVYHKNIGDATAIQLELNLPNGIYFVKLNSLQGSQIKKMIIDK